MIHQNSFGFYSWDYHASYFRLRAGVCNALALMQKIMLEHGRILPANAVEQQRRAYLIFRSVYNKLAKGALEAGLCRWPVRPKNHYVEHLIYDISPLNGRYLHNYVSADFVRRTKHMAAKSHPGYLSKHVSFKYALQTCMRWR